MLVRAMRIAEARARRGNCDSLVTPENPPPPPTRARARRVNGRPGAALLQPHHPGAFGSVQGGGDLLHGGDAAGFPPGAVDLDDPLLPHPMGRFLSGWLEAGER